MPYDPVEYFPHIYGNFRKKGEATKVRSMLDSPQKDDLPFYNKIEKITDVEKKALEFMPNLADFGFSKDEIAT